MRENNNYFIENFICLSYINLMKIININTSDKYDCIVGSDIIKQDSDFCDRIKKIYFGNDNPKCLIVTDDKVDGLHYLTLSKALGNLNISFQKFVLKNGEQSKNFNEYKNIINALAQSDLKKNDLIIAFGGGVIGDISGFAASTWLRGIKYIQIPTTLLAMVDSSVGGKCAIDTEYGKNLVGSFWQPSAVFANINFLDTLPAEIFSDGMSEIIKSAILKSPELFNHLEENGYNFDREFVISETIKIKNYYVSHDEKESGIRQMLNLGHTIAHAIEKLSNYKTSHGRAVAIGLDLISKISVKNNMLDKKNYERIHNLIKKFNLPTESEYTINEMINIIGIDKKTHGRKINLIIPIDIGDCKIHTIELSQLNEFLKI